MILRFLICLLKLILNYNQNIMPKYAEDLTAYLEKIGENPPTAALEDPALLKRALSQESPISLVAKVAEQLEDVDNHPAITELTAYERGRIMSTLGRKEDAIALYKEALETCEDPELKGLISVNLSNDLDGSDPTQREELYRSAMECGNDEVRANFGMFLHQNGRTQEAIAILIEGIKKGVEFCMPVLGQIYVQTMKGEDLDKAMLEIITLAQKAGIKDPANAGFDQLDYQTLARSKDGKTFNIFAVLGPLRRATDRFFKALSSKA